MLLGLHRIKWMALLIVFATTTCHGLEILGTGTDSLLGNDLTDEGDDGVEGDYAPPNLGGFDAEFFSSDEPGFGGGEFAFNVFDNTLGPGNDKWCCGTAFPQIVGAVFPQPSTLSHFTVSSANDVDTRDPRVWTIDGSNDGVNWTTIFSQDDPSAALWDERLQVIRFDAGTDFPAQETAYSQLRLNVLETGATSGAFFQIGEIEFFGASLPPSGDFDMSGVVDETDFFILNDNLAAHLDRAVTNADGDYDNDGDVDLDDFGGFNTAHPAVVARALAIPEPSSLTLMVCALFGLWGLARRQS